MTEITQCLAERCSSRIGAKSSPCAPETRSIKDRIILIGKIVKNATLIAALATSVAFSASAMTAKIDTDGDGMASLAELQVSYPDLTEVLFQEIDTDSDGLINDEEMAIAVELGNLSDPETDT